MICPNCDTQNASGVRFCQECGYKFENVAPVPPPQQQVPPGYRPPARPMDPMATLRTIGMLAGFGGGGLIVLGWFLPWFNLGGLMRGILGGMDLLGELMGMGGMNLGGSFGNGLQMFLATLFGGFALLFDGDSFLIGLLALLIAGTLVTLPIIAILNIRSGFRIYESQRTGRFDTHGLDREMGIMQRRSVTVFVILVIFFLLMALVSISILGTGFWVSMLGAVGTWFAVFYAKNQAR